MASRHITLCDALVEYLNDLTQQAGYVVPFVSTRVNLPRYDLEELTDDLSVVVFPGPRLPEKIGRNTWLKTYTVFVLIAKKLNPASGTEEQDFEDQLIELAEEIEDSVYDTRFDGMSCLPLEGVEFPPYIEDWLKQDDTFVQIIEFAFAEGVESGR